MGNNPLHVRTSVYNDAHTNQREIKKMIALIGKMSSRAVDGLVAATGTKINETNNAKGISTFYAFGESFKARSEIGHHILKACNEWMIEAGLVNMETIEQTETNGGKAFSTK